MLILKAIHSMVMNDWNHWHTSYREIEAQLLINFLVKSKTRKGFNLNTSRIKQLKWSAIWVICVYLGTAATVLFSHSLFNMLNKSHWSVPHQEMLSDRMNLPFLFSSCFLTALLPFSHWGNADRCLYFFLTLLPCHRYSCSFSSQAVAKGGLIILWYSEKSFSIS